MHHFARSLEQVYLQHYAKYMDVGHFEEVKEQISKLIGGYKELESQDEQKKVARLQPLI